MVSDMVECDAPWSCACTLPTDHTGGWRGGPWTCDVMLNAQFCVTYIAFKNYHNRALRPTPIAKNTVASPLSLSTPHRPLPCSPLPRPSPGPQPPLPPHPPCDTLVRRPSPHSSTMEGDCCVLGTPQEASRIVLYRSYHPRRLSRATLALLAHRQPCLLLRLARRVAEELYRLDHGVGN